MIVADTNLVAALLLPSELSSTASRIFERDPEWLVPLLWRSEWRSVLLKFLRAGRIDLPGAVALATWAEERLSGRERLVESAEVLRLAASSGCSAYDCEYVALAEALDVPLVTSDARVLAAFPAVARSPRAQLEVLQ